MVNQSEKFARFAGTEGVRLDLKSKSVRAALYMAVGNGGDFLLRMVSISILARVLIPAQFGLVAMVTAITAIAGQISNLGLSTATVQRREINYKQVTNLFWINVAFGALITVIICALAPLIAAFYRDPRLVPITIAISTSFLWGGFTTQHEALLIRQMKQAQSAFVRLGASFLSVCLAIVLAMGGYGYWALVWQEVARSFLTAVGIWVFCPWRPGLPHRSEDVRSLLWFGADLTLVQVFCAVISNVDRVLIGKLFGASPLGMYRQAQQLIMAPIEQLNGPIGSAAQPGLSMLQDDPSRYRRYYQKIVFLIGLVTMPVAAFAAVYANEITLVVLGNKWLGAGPFFRIFAVAAFIRPVLGTAGMVLVTCGRSRRLLVITFVSQLTFLLFMFAGLRWGVQGVAMAYLLTPAVLMLPNLYYSFRGSPVTLGTFFLAIKTPLVASAVIVAGLLAFRSVAPNQGTLLSICSGGSVAAVLFFASGLLSRGSRAELKALLADVVGSLPGARARVVGSVG